MLDEIKQAEEKAAMLVADAREKAQRITETAADEARSRIEGVRSTGSALRERLVSEAVARAEKESATHTETALKKIREESVSFGKKVERAADELVKRLLS